MLLSPDDAELFFRLHRSLMHFVNQRLGVVPNVAGPVEFAELPPEDRLEVRKAFLDNIDLIETFVDENPAKLGEDELEIVLSWRHHVSDTFYAFRQLKNYMVFLSSADPPVAFGVVALTEPFEDLIGPYLPRMTETVLLPFKERIVYDGLLSGYNISFGGGIKRILNDSYRQASPSAPTSSIRCASRESGHARRKMSAACGVTRSFCRPWPIHITNGTTSFSIGAVRSILTHSTPPKQRGRCKRDYRHGGNGTFVVS